MDSMDSMDGMDEFWKEFIKKIKQQRLEHKIDQSQNVFVLEVNDDTLRRFKEYLDHRISLMQK